MATIRNGVPHPLGQSWVAFRMSLLPFVLNVCVKNVRGYLLVGRATRHLGPASTAGLL
jgi:hypothetical protein